MTSEQKRAEFGKLSGNFQNGIPGIEKKKKWSHKIQIFHILGTAIAPHIYEKYRVGQRECSEKFV